MHLSPRQTRTLLSAMVVTAAWIYYYLSSASAEPRLNILDTIAELEHLSSTLDAMHEEFLSFNTSFLGLEEPNINTVAAQAFLEPDPKKLDADEATAETNDHPYDDFLPEKRAPSERTLYKDAVKKGKSLYKLFGRTTCVPETKFFDPIALKNWGWTNVNSLKVASKMDQITNVLDALKLSKQVSFGNEGPKGGFISMEWTHTETTKTPPDVVPKKIYAPTGGQIFNLYNPTDGAIIAHHNYGPAYMVENRVAPYGSEFPRTGLLPELKQWSDIVYLTWDELTSTTQQLKNLKWVIRLNVDNEETKQIISRALKRDQVASGIAPEWGTDTDNNGHPKPKAFGDGGHQFKFYPNAQDLSSNTQFYAMLGSPHCAGVAWLLAQHQIDEDGDELFGRKRIKSITVWSPNGDGYNSNILMEIVDF